MLVVSTCTETEHGPERSANNENMDIVNPAVRGDTEYHHGMLCGAVSIWLLRPSPLRLWVSV